MTAKGCVSTESTGEYVAEIKKDVMTMTPYGYKTGTDSRMSDEGIFMLPNGTGTALENVAYAHGIEDTEHPGTYPWQFTN